MKIFADDEQGTETIDALVTSIRDSNAMVVFLERKTGYSNRQDIAGLNDVLTHAPSGTPIIMLGWMSPTMSHYANDPRWHAALGYPNVVFRRLPEGLNDLNNAFEEATGKNRPADPLAIALLTVKTTQTAARVLHHDLSYAERSSEGMAEWLERARKQFGEKTEVELIETVGRVRSEEATEGQLAGKAFPDTCVDVEGTLFDYNGTFQPTVLENAIAQAHGQPITIWTDGDMNATRKILREHRVPYKLVSKQALAGATVDSVIDNLPEAEFREAYNVRYNHYTQVTT